MFGGTVHCLRAFSALPEDLSSLLGLYLRQPTSDARRLSFGWLQAAQRCCWEPNSGVLEGQQALLTTDMSPQISIQWIFYIKKDSLVKRQEEREKAKGLLYLLQRRKVNEIPTTESKQKADEDSLSKHRVSLMLV